MCGLHWRTNLKPVSRFCKQFKHWPRTETETPPPGPAPANMAEKQIAHCDATNFHSACHTTRAVRIRASTVPTLAGMEGYVREGRWFGQTQTCLAPGTIGTNVL
jgi:hypothetical protein